ncbi:MAG: hypothetical protein ACKUBY_05640 [Candidatus Moraniibacteriota bacterium]|jgi:hypothetical protein
MKPVDIGKKLWGFYSDAHTIISMVKGGDSSTSKSATDTSGARADTKGKDQTDERLTLASFARAIWRLENDFKMSHKEAVAGIQNLLTVINSYTQKEINAISLTFGLEQSKIENRSYDKNTGKPSSKETTYENLDGQEIAIMIVRANDPNFTRLVCDFSIASTKVFAENIKLWKKRIWDLLSTFDKKLDKTLDEIGELLDKPFQEMSVSNPNGLYKPPIWVSFTFFWRSYFIKKYRQKHLENLSMNQ